MATSWAVDTGKVRSCTASAVPLTEDVPTTSTAVGLDISGISALSVCVRAPSAQTFVTGTLAGYVYVPIAAKWARLPPSSDVDMAQFVGLETVCLTPQYVPAGVGRFMYAPVSVTVSGAGTSLTMHYTAVNALGGIK